MKITWIGQSGYVIKTAQAEIIIDPYLSDVVNRVARRERLVEAPIKPEEIRADAVICTHNHLDHTDPDTLCHYLGEDTSVCVLASENAWNKVRKLFGGINNNYVSFNEGTEWTEKGIHFQAVRANHSDNRAIGVLITAEDKTYYVTGDTLYDERILSSLPKKADVVFLPVNGIGNNMNMVDAKRFCEKLGALAVPMHCGLFDENDMNDFEYENKIVPEFYKEIKII
jgi:L-ascorbate 6-phosphate lactonase